MTSAIDQVLAAAKSISQSGRNPTLALIKTKLGTSIPMPTLIQGLQQYKAMSATEQQALVPLTVVTEPAKVDSPATNLEELQQAYNQLNDKYSSLNQRVAELEEQLKRIQGQ
ncbi:hypothetical protein [Shewanella waksmanii]|uniref:hypothetical protein n=1 Tax=Shewanella waksmanii TaxID=213783 RepID=UPI0037370497